MNELRLDLRDLASHATAMARPALLGEADERFLAFAREAIGELKQGRDSPQVGVPSGVVTRRRHVSEGAYPGVARDCWIYVPTQYDGSRPAALMVFQDGASYLADGVNVPMVLDNLIAEGHVPPMIAFLIAPGDKGPGEPVTGGVDNRSLEYDAVGDHYVRFLTEELLPLVEREHAVSSDPEMRAICGFSSGGICAFTAAWERPDVFGKVLIHCGSFVNIRGGNAYPSLIRRSERRPLRIFMTSGMRDLDNHFGNWRLANEDLAAALAYKDYDFRFELGQGGHSLNHGGAILAQSLRWLWRDYRPA